MGGGCPTGGHAGWWEYLEWVGGCSYCGWVTRCWAVCTAPGLGAEPSPVPYGVPGAPRNPAGLPHGWGTLGVTPGDAWKPHGTSHPAPNRGRGCPQMPSSTSPWSSDALQHWCMGGEQDAALGRAGLAQGAGADGPYVVSQLLGCLASLCRAWGGCWAWWGAETPPPQHPAASRKAPPCCSRAREGGGGDGGGPRPVIQRCPCAWRLCRSQVTAPGGCGGDRVPPPLAVGDRACSALGRGHPAGGGL